MLNGETAAVNEFFHSNARLMPEFNMTVTTRQNVDLYYKALHKRFDVTRYAREEKEILDLGSHVVEWGLFTMNLTHKAQKKEFIFQGKYMDIWEKDVLGKWSLTTQAWNYNHTTDISEQFRFTDVPVVNIALAAHAQINNNTSFELAGLNELMESVIIQHDATRWKMFYSDSGNFMYSNTPLYAGRAGLDRFFDEHVAGLPIFEKLDIRNDRIDDLGEYVIEYASHTAFVRGENWSGTGTGKDIRIWRRENCSLKIFRHIGMYD
jgi:hypothetical protein